MNRGVLEEMFADSLVCLKFDVYSSVIFLAEEGGGADVV